MTWLLSLISGSKIWLYVLIFVAGAGMIAWIFFSGKKAGEQAAKIEGLVRSLDTYKRMQDAEARSARSPGDLDKRLRDGKF